jgi:hypothetical protein
MPRSEIVLQVLVASPNDVAEERALLEEVVRELNITWSKNLGIRLELVKWETHAYPGIGTDPQAVINEQIGEDYDIFIGIIWKHFGTPTGRANSGTAEEFDRAYKRFRENPSQLRIMFYFKDTPVPPSELDPSQLVLIKDFRERLGEKGTLYWTYTNREEFATLLRMHLSRQVQKWQKTSGSENVSDISKEGSVSPVTAPKVNVQTEEEEEGFLDLIERGHDNFVTLNEVLYRMATIIESLGKKTDSRRLEIKELQTSQVGFNTKQAKRVINLIADDMQQFVIQIKADIPLFAKSYSTGIDALARAATLLSDFQSEDKRSVEDALTTIKNLKLSLGSSQKEISSFRTIIATLPRLTTSFNRARRNTLYALEELDREMTSAMNLTSEAEKLLEKVLVDR